jgi:arylsulfatase A-like enzyme
VQAAFWDILPTFSAITKTGHMPVTDGISILPALKGKKMNAERPLYWEFYEGGFKQAVRLGDWKAIRFYKGTAPVRTELYNLKNDIGEKQDLAATEPDKLKTLTEAMDKERTASEHSLFQIK